MPIGNPLSMPLGEHLEELRTRLIVAMLGLIPIVAVSLTFGKQLLGFLMRPAEDALGGRLMALSPFETFSAYMKVSFIAAIIAGSPWLLIQLWLFVRPGLYSHERRYVYFLIPMSAVLTGVGVVFLYKIVMPLILAFFVGFGADISLKTAGKLDTAPAILGPTVPVLAADPPTPKTGEYWINTNLKQLRICESISETGTPKISFLQLHPDQGIEQQIRISDYIDLLFTLTIAFAATFQTPIVVLLLGWSGLIDNAFLKKYRRHALVATLVIAALIAPGDPTSLLLIWAPLVVLYELGGLLLRVFPSSRVSGVREGDSDDSP